MPDRRLLLCFPLIGLMLVLGALGVLGGRMPHSMHRPTPVVQRAGGTSDTVVAIADGLPPDIAARALASVPQPVPCVESRRVIQPVLLAAALHTRAP